VRLGRNEVRVRGCKAMRVFGEGLRSMDEEATQEKDQWMKRLI
jgi:hypothetical protein